MSSTVDCSYTWRSASLGCELLGFNCKKGTWTSSPLSHIYLCWDTNTNARSHSKSALLINIILKKLMREASKMNRRNITVNSRLVLLCILLSLPEKLILQRRKGASNWKDVKVPWWCTKGHSWFSKHYPDEQSNNFFLSLYIHAFTDLIMRIFIQVCVYLIGESSKGHDTSKKNCTAQEMGLISSQGLWYVILILRSALKVKARLCQRSIQLVPSLRYLSLADM